MDLTLRPVHRLKGVPSAKLPTIAGRLPALTEPLLCADCQDVRNDSVAVGGLKIRPMRHRIDDVRPILGSIMPERR
jgi:hypothetical protein